MSTGFKSWLVPPVLTFFVLSASVVPVIVNPGVAYAQQAFCAQQGHWFAGYLTKAGSEPVPAEGVDALLTYRALRLCTSDNNPGTNASSGWTMVASPNNGGYTQSGFNYHITAQCETHFAEMNPFGTTFTHVNGACTQPGEQHAAWSEAYWNGSDWREASGIDSTTFIASNFNPFFVWGQNFSIQLFGEIFYIGDSVPGTPTAPVDWANLNAQSYQTDQFVDFCGAETTFWISVAQAPASGQNVTSCDSIQSYATN